jgi:hypothetical protein
MHNNKNNNNVFQRYVHSVNIKSTGVGVGMYARMSFLQSIINDEEPLWLSSKVVKMRK